MAAVECLHCGATSCKPLASQSTTTANAYRCLACKKVFTAPTAIGRNTWLLQLGMAAVTGLVMYETNHLLNGSSTDLFS